MSESIKITCVHCGGHPLQCRHVAFVQPWYRQAKTGNEGSNPGGSEALVGGRDEPENLVQEEGN